MWMLHGVKKKILYGANAVDGEEPGRQKDETRRGTSRLLIGILLFGKDGFQTPGQGEISHASNYG
jgi:hypothetical protein